jgi:hypothetical protein
MEHLTYDALLRDPDLLDELVRAARRERAETAHRLLSDVLQALIARSHRPAAGQALQPSGCS